MTGTPPTRPWPGAAMDRAAGALVGLAVGDALGTTLEFSPRGPHARHTEMAGGGPFGLAPGQWTDDTAMALALAESLLARGRFDAADAMEAFLRWWRFGHHSCTGACFDIGATTAVYRAVQFQATGRSKTRPLRRSAANVIGQRKPKPHKPLQPIRPLDSRWLEPAAHGVEVA